LSYFDDSFFDFFAFFSDEHFVKRPFLSRHCLAFFDFLDFLDFLLFFAFLPFLPLRPSFFSSLFSPLRMAFLTVFFAFLATFLTAFFALRITFFAFFTAVFFALRAAPAHGGRTGRR
jgi:hypothetical protein